MTNKIVIVTVYSVQKVRSQIKSIAKCHKDKAMAITHYKRGLSEVSNHIELALISNE